jgi:hypothetical protein
MTSPPGLAWLGAADPWLAADGAARQAVEQATAPWLRLSEAGPPLWAAWDAAEGVLCGLIREVAGNPFRRPSIAPALLGWRDRLVVRLAQAAYAEGAFERLPILADALEEAGCTDAEVLGHLRGPGPHVRGCWVLDTLTGRR